MEFGGEIIKFEIFCEARISLDASERPSWAPVDCLALVDTWSEKLLANTDRWADDSVAGRDLIDLCVLRRAGPMLARSVEKASRAYEVLPALARAIESFQRRADFRARCFEALAIEAPWVHDILDGLDALAAEVGLPKTERRSEEWRSTTTT